jgi:multidrug resistance efflux pump
MQLKYKFLNSFLNILYFLFVFVAALAIATLALVRKVNSYEASREPLFFAIQKEQIMITSPVAGRLEEVYVKTGQHVKRGDLLAQLADESLDLKINALEDAGSDNLSAKTEAQVLKAQKEQFAIKAPKDGVIYKIDSASGSYLGTSSPIMTMFGDEKVKLNGYLNPVQYADIQKNKQLDVYSPRFQQIYRIELEGVGKVYSGDAYTNSRYEVVFRFADSEEGPAFLEGESMEVVAKTKDDGAKRPTDRVVEFWNKFLIGK